jgi:hypothetical protein
MDAPDLNGEVTICEDKSWEPMGPWAKDTVLDLSDPTGRFHARLWLLERGHDVGSEDRAEVLAWSVLSVWRGGRALPVAGAWDGSGERWVEGRWTVAHVTHTGWWVGGESGHETGNVAKTAADAALLRLGWALTNPDGSLTLPPLPGGAQ